jgi:hypothetical protein
MAQARRLSHAFLAAGLLGAAVSSAWLEGCAATRRTGGALPTAANPNAPAAVSTAAVATAPASTGAASTGAVSHDFGALVPAPFGTAFQDMPVPLTEVLVFHPPGAERTGEDADCFRPDGAVSFLGRVPTEHLLCFDHDRLRRVQASVALPAADAAAVFAAACADWRRGDAASTQEPEACEGHRGDIAFSARRAEGPDPAAATVSITLEGVSP